MYGGLMSLIRRASWSIASTSEPVSRKSTDSTFAVISAILGPLEVIKSLLCWK